MALLMFQGVAVLVPDQDVNKSFVLGMFVCSIAVLFVAKTTLGARAHAVFQTLLRRRSRLPVGDTPAMRVPLAG